MAGAQASAIRIASGKLAPPLSFPPSLPPLFRHACSSFFCQGEHSQTYRFVAQLTRVVLPPQTLSRSAPRAVPSLARGLATAQDPYDVVVIGGGKSESLLSYRAAP